MASTILFYVSLTFGLLSLVALSESATCPPYNWVANGFLTHWQSNKTVSNQYQTLITLYCVPGFTPTDPGGIARCEANGTWSGSVGSCIPTGSLKKACSPPEPSIPYIKYDPDLPIVEDLKYPNGTRAMLSCPSGYYLEVNGSYWKTCINGQWNGSLGRCKLLVQ